MFKEYFTKRHSYMLLEDFGDESLKEKVNLFINRFMNYCAKLSSDELTKLNRNVEEYTTGPWTIRTSYPDDETFRGNNQFPKIRLSFSEEGKNVELQISLPEDLDSFLDKTLAGNLIPLVTFTVAQHTSSPYKYNEDVQSFSVAKSGKSKRKYVTSNGRLFGNKIEIVCEKEVDAAENEN